MFKIRNSEFLCVVLRGLVLASILLLKLVHSLLFCAFFAPLRGKYSWPPRFLLSLEIWALPLSRPLSRPKCSKTLDSIMLSRCHDLKHASSGGKHLVAAEVRRRNRANGSQRELQTPTDAIGHLRTPNLTNSADPANNSPIQLQCRHPSRVPLHFPSWPASILLPRM